MGAAIVCVLAGLLLGASAPGGSSTGASPSGQVVARDPDAADAEAPEPASAAPELPGGGRTVFPKRRMVALYGSPGALRSVRWDGRASTSPSRASARWPPTISDSAPNP